MRPQIFFSRTIEKLGRTLEPCKHSAQYLLSPVSYPYIKVDITYAVSSNLVLILSTNTIVYYHGKSQDHAKLLSSDCLQAVIST